MVYGSVFVTAFGIILVPCVYLQIGVVDGVTTCVVLYSLRLRRMNYFNTECTFYYPHRCISFLPYPRKAALTKLRGHRGRNSGKPLFVNQGRGQRQPYVATLNSSRFFQKNPMIVISSRLFHLSRTFVTFLKSGAGLIFTLRNLQLRPLSYFFYNYRGLLPKHPDYYTTKQLLFLKVGSRLVNIRDIFSCHVLFAVAFGSYAVLKFFDRWSGFLTVSLPSGMARLFFFLSRADY